jgi:hypothetical protein
MHMLKHICQATVSLNKQAWRFAQFAAVAINQKRRQITQGKFEGERLDRIRNPSKYLGKG